MTKILTHPFAARAWLIAVLMLAAHLAAPSALLAQNDETVGPAADQTADDSADSDATDDASASEDTAETPQDGINVLKLFVRGGWLMLPIVAMLAVVVFFSIERCFGLMRRKVLPVELIDELGDLGNSSGGFDPRKAYRISQQYPSSASAVIRTMLLKVGRPHSEVEHAVAEACEREAARLYSNVRILNLAAAVTPLMGLLGTVWGMIGAFFEATQMTAGQNKADLLAKGIYVALVTTFAGLLVAIPAAVVAHFFEGRIQTLFREIEELLLSLLPHVERFEGRLRVSRQQLSEEPAPAQPPPPPVEAKVAGKSP
jgi:biopolymer transport protein ExbB